MKKQAAGLKNNTEKSIINNCIVPDWPVADSIKSLVTTRNNGFSKYPWNSFNLATHVNDKLKYVEKNRELLRQILPSEPFWLEQIHSQKIIKVEKNILSADGSVPIADGSYSLKPNQVCAVLTADCLPILFATEDATVVAAVHAGWRGLASGIIDNAVKLLSQKAELPAQKILVWLGPAISKKYFEVGSEVREQFIAANPHYESAFMHTNKNKYMADIYLLAKINLQHMGVTKIYGGDFCTYNDKENFYSYRRDGVTGRMVSLIWKTN